jgi:chromosomal replication initiation ATPase DnaA
MVSEIEKLQADIAELEIRLQDKRARLEAMKRISNESPTDPVDEAQRKCRTLGWDWHTLKSPCRKEELVIKRSILMLYFKRHGLTLKMIGKLLNRDHSTVINSMQNVEQMIETDYPPFVNDLKKFVDA